MQYGNAQTKGDNDIATSAKVIYAQSSDIRSRTYLDYRRDMKKKAIAELEFLPFLEKILSEKLQANDLRLKKYGSDADLWFSASGKISQQPDYKAEWNSNKFSLLYEFQYAEKTDGLNFFDFKVSKVGKMEKGKRIPHKDREFFYVVKPQKQYAFIAPQWIMKHGKVAGVPAWGNSTAYRVPHKKFMKQLQSGGADIVKVIEAVDAKNTLLNFQHDFLDLENAKLSRRLQEVVDEKQLLQIVPNSLTGFYEVCYLLDKLNKIPEKPSVWLVYLASFFDQINTAMELAQFMFALDFLYFKSTHLSKNEIVTLENVVKKVEIFINNFPKTNGLFASNPNEIPLEETRRILFAINLLEDLIQNLVVLEKCNLKRIDKIFQSVSNPLQIATLISA